MENLRLLKDILLKTTDDPFVIAEVGQAHEGSLGQAMSFIDSVAKTGANAIKFQTHIAAEESSNYDNFRVNVFPQDKTRYDYWRRMEFTREQWKMLAARARENGLVFLSSPFSKLAVDILTECEMKAWKIASGELGNYPMLDKIMSTKEPLLISTGMSNWEEIDEIYNYTEGRDRVIFQCTTSYPSQPGTIGLNNITEMQKRYGDCVVGLSDHSGEIYPCMSAYMLGARVFEVHVTWSKQMFGPDTAASLDLAQLEELVRYLNLQSETLKSPIDKDKLREEKSDLVMLFGRGVFAKNKIEQGKTIAEMDLCYLKPALGISAKKYQFVIGQKAKQTIEAGAPISESDLQI